MTRNPAPTTCAAWRAASHVIEGEADGRGLSEDELTLYGPYGEPVLVVRGTAQELLAYVERIRTQALYLTKRAEQRARETWS